MNSKNTENNSAARSIMTRKHRYMEYFKRARKIGLAAFRISDTKASGTRMGRPVSVRFCQIRIADFFGVRYPKWERKKAFFGFGTSDTGTGRPVRVVGCFRVAGLTYI